MLNPGSVSRRVVFGAIYLIGFLLVVMYFTGIMANRRDVFTVVGAGVAIAMVGVLVFLVRLPAHDTMKWAKWAAMSIVSMGVCSGLSILGIARGWDAMAWIPGYVALAAFAGYLVLMRVARRVRRRSGQETRRARKGVLEGLPSRVQKIVDDPLPEGGWRPSLGNREGHRRRFPAECLRPVEHVYVRQLYADWRAGLG